MSKTILNKLSSIKKQKKAIRFISENKEAILAAKINVIKTTDAVATKNIINDVVARDINKLNKASKNGLKADEALVKFIANTYLYMDSHDDVHDKGVFTKTVKERGDKLFHLLDHSYKLTSKMGSIETIEEKEIKWRDLNIDKKGKTTILLVTSKIQKNRNPAVYNDYIEEKVNQHSVGMWYVKVLFAVNDPEQKEEYATYNKYISKLGNQDKAEKQGYFFVVKEAGLREVSGVLEGSNEITHTIDVEQGKKKKKNKNKKVNAIKAFLKQ